MKYNEMLVLFFETYEEVSQTFIVTILSQTMQKFPKTRHIYICSDCNIAKKNYVLHMG